MDLYSILGQQLSVDEALPPETAPAAAARLLRAQPSGAEPILESQLLPGTSSLAAPPELISGGPALREVGPHLAPGPPEDGILAARLEVEEKLDAYLAAAVERVRYITNASGVALALCEKLSSPVSQSGNPLENPEDAMVCHASSGPAAPEVGARMYIRSGITAESIRTRQTLRCDRASTDPRVNQESCKALGIESVMVLPLILDRSVVGMFELFGSKPSAFAERDATTLRASTPQVESALREAVAAGMPLGLIAWAEEAPAARNIPPHEGDSESLTDTSVTLKVPVAFPIDAFRKPESPPSEQPGEPEVPAFLARLADEARPASSRAWSQWFRPQW
jgi:putative methionine-R-sulfoxide reductase with GAF domain